MINKIKRKISNIEQNRQQPQDVNNFRKFSIQIFDYAASMPL